MTTVSIPNISKLIVSKPISFIFTFLQRIEGIIVKAILNIGSKFNTALHFAAFGKANAQTYIVHKLKWGRYTLIIFFSAIKPVTGGMVPLATLWCSKVLPPLALLKIIFTSTTVHIVSLCYLRCFNIIDSKKPYPEVNYQSNVKF